MHQKTFLAIVVVEQQLTRPLFFPWYHLHPRPHTPKNMAMKVAQLRTELVRRKQSPTGNKGVLRARLLAWAGIVDVQGNTAGGGRAGSVPPQQDQNPADAEVVDLTSAPATITKTIGKGARKKTLVWELQSDRITSDERVEPRFKSHLMGLSEMVEAEMTEFNSWIVSHPGG